jgi:hypothetical protein
LDLLIEAFAVIAIFSAVHERVLEVLRSTAVYLKAHEGALKALDRFTIGGLNWVSAVLLALASKANLFTLFSSGSAGVGVKAFFTHYLTDLFAPGFWDPKAVLGCVLMGLTTTLGSQFWHDTVRVLVDLRARLRSLPEAARKLAQFEDPQALAEQALRRAA